MRSSVIQNNPEENVLRFRRREVMFLVPTKALRVFVKRFRRIRLFLIRREFLSETGTKINFRFRYRRKWILTRQKCPTDLKKFSSDAWNVAIPTEMKYILVGYILATEIYLNNRSAVFCTCLIRLDSSFPRSNFIF